MNKILVAIDFSEKTPLIISQAQAIAASTDSQIFLVHITPPDPDFVGYETGPQTERDFLAHQFREEHRQIQQLAEALRQQQLKAVGLLLNGSTVETIIKEAEKLRVDLIVVGSHGRGGLVKILVGSVSEGILRHAKVPVLVVPTR